MKKKISVIGDSISTLAGYNPEGYSVFYDGANCFAADISGPEDTWWGRVAGYLCGEILVNDSYSGSQASKYTGREELFPSACSPKRTGNLHRGAEKPDAVIIYVGTNDWGRGVPLYESCTAIPEESFYGGYKKTVCDVKRNYPSAEIFVCTLMRAYKKNDPSFVFPDRTGDRSMEEYNDVIRKIAAGQGCVLLDLYSYKRPYDCIDGAHPSKNGMKTIAELMLREILSKR